MIWVNLCEWKGPRWKKYIRTEFRSVDFKDYLEVAIYCRDFIVIKNWSISVISTESNISYIPVNYVWIYRHFLWHKGNNNNICEGLNHFIIHILLSSMHSRREMINALVGISRHLGKACVWKWISVLSPALFNAGNIHKRGTDWDKIPSLTRECAFKSS